MARKYFSSELGTWHFCDQIMKIWPFAEAVWAHIFFAFCEYFWKFGHILAQFECGTTFWNLNT